MVHLIRYSDTGTNLGKIGTLAGYDHYGAARAPERLVDFVGSGFLA